MRRYRATKIVATLGPVSSSPEIIEQLFLKGVDVFRLNFSHGTHETHLKNYKIIRVLETKYGHPIGILQDLQGPKLRVGAFKEGKIDLKVGDYFRFDLDPTPGDFRRVNLPHPEIFAALKKETDLLLDDGKLRLKVQTHGPDFAEALVIVGGPLSNSKGVNVPDVTLPISALTEKDRKDLAFGLEMGVDWVALSFVQRPEDVIEVKSIIGNRASVIAKLEKPMAIEYLDDIVSVSDGIMVARGDLGVEMLPEAVPPLQKRIIRACRMSGKPVIVATQMLDSMVQLPTPTRAEASDVATAVYDGVDAVMLSAESASGAYAQEAVSMMNRIIESVEKDAYYHQQLKNSRTPWQSTSSDAITAAARQVAETIEAKAIVTLTTTGATTFRAARERPSTPILSLTPNPQVARLLSLVWGTHPIEMQEFDSIIEIDIRVSHLAMQNEFARKGDNLVLTIGGDFTRHDAPRVFHSGTTRLLSIINVTEE
ncbi:MAG: pyruvate kinase [Candidatus Paracaedimonas acanthamoebae]|uniref:Pyruvate kinase n=1 Tax=Candidatus Paracaedimonas acanthamoebae TaxID=244581 RepID=A0A8J7PK21_9PROT|nr:pyruvate kinase [Candidatus Paracaedimonas acanthamoebae]